MYPLFRFAKELVKFRNAPRLAVTGTHVSTHVCWPWDLDPWIELNNGRTLTLFDLGRIPMAQRSGLIPILCERGWGITVAGSSTRYRRRIRLFHRFTMFSRVAGWDGRFIYMDQSMWTASGCCNQVLIRAAITGPGGIVPPAEVMTALGAPVESPALPLWMAAWAEAEGTRPWPPEIAAEAKAHLPA